MAEVNGHPGRAAVPGKRQWMAIKQLSYMASFRLVSPLEPDGALSRLTLV
jgi:hypothetical protein